MEAAVREEILGKRPPLNLSCRAVMIVSWGFEKGIALDCPSPSCLDHKLRLQEEVLGKRPPLTLSRQAGMVVSWDFEKGITLDCPSSSCLDHKLGLREGVLKKGLPLTLSCRGAMISHVALPENGFCKSQEFNLATPCIQRSMIDALNLTFFLVFAIGFFISYLRRDYDHGRRTRSWDSIITAALCAVLGVADVGLSFLLHLNWVIYTVRGIIWISLALSLCIRPPKWLRAVILTWWISFSLLISAFNVEILVQGRGFSIFVLLSWPVNLLLLFCAFRELTGARVHESLSRPLLVIEAERIRRNLTQANWFSRLTFSWLNPLLRFGFSKPLALEDIPGLDSEDEAFVAHQTFCKAWEELDLRKNKERTRNLVLFALAKCYKKEMLLVGLYALLKSVSVATSPLILYAFISYSNQEEKDLSFGFCLVFLLVITKFIESFSQRHWFFDSRRVGMRMRSAVMAAIFQKQMKLSVQGRRRHSTGEIVNYIAVDAYRLGEFPWWFHMSWSLPLQLLLSIIVLFGIVGLGALPGLVPLVVFGFLNLPIAKALQYYQSQFMFAQDERLRATSEVLNNMKVIKLQSWEEKFRGVIKSLRDAEFKWLKDIQIIKSYGTALYWMSPTIVSAVIFAGTAVFNSAPLNAGTIFTVLATLRVMSEPVRVLPEALSVLIQVKVSLDRIDVFLLEEEIKEEDGQRSLLGGDEISVQVHEGFFSWNLNGAIPTLKNINLEVKRGKKIAVCGPVGAGKSSLLHAMLGEIPKISGSINVFGSAAYVSQTSWIQSGTIQENILYGKPMNKMRYKMSIECCALDKDIENFDQGDLTEIGQRGLNMSGGQKQRIQLARAVYNDADVYLLDDPFSAVDAHTAAILFNECVMNVLKNKTVILVTHQVEFLAEADEILVIENGEITQNGTYGELLQSGRAFEKLVNAHQSSMMILDSAAEEKRGQKGRRAENDPRQNSESEIFSKDIFEANKLTEDEAKEIGNVGWKPYKDYFNVSEGVLLCASVFSTQFLFVILQTLSTYWLAFAIQISGISSSLLVGVYAVISILSCLFAFIRTLLSAHMGLKASRSFFTALMESVFKAPMSFFDSTPVGRILTRVSSDLSILDFDIPYSLVFCLAGSVEVLSIIIIMATVTWQVLVVAIPVLIIIRYLQNYYLSSARELVRINGTTKAPIMNYAAESYLGVVTIRAFRSVDRFFSTNLKLIDTDAALFFHTIAAMEWVLIRVELLQNITIITSTLFLVLVPQGTISPGFSGLCLSYALTLSAAQVFLTRFYSYMENHIISVERIKQFMHIPPEPPAVINGSRPPPSWPHEGRIDLQNLKIRYRPAAPFVLKGITCSMAAGNRIGVVGRTGSGKTTLISALFRVIDPAEGRILIDNLDITSIGLKDLRMKLSIIPQEPTLFRGSIRSNMDPLGLYTDHEIWEALERCQLKATIRNLPSQLDSSVSDDGENWSAGQRQLFCLGRVLLRKNRILVLDEATASIDSATDAVLQRIIREEFCSCTVITIAHRVPTVTDSDVVMVLSYGKLVEYDEPSKLMESQSSAFAMLVAEYWANYTKDSLQ
ncbi:ABC transporter C family member 8 [Apostasia shenzhenica]|uniref:ABC transporter C family member 8 n=1 Tax=Apostasia shenzhenica TaxID=1088818 RepID=A0A2I0ATZ7_9ASPA|nr:ABC transporter C family member 8 [Apostasia shenzhenica]